MRFPTLYTKESSRQMIDTFKGYNHNLRIGDGEFYDMENMTSDHYPVLSVRDRRCDYEGNIQPQGMTVFDGKLAFVDGTMLRIGRSSYELGLSESGPKQLIPFGRRLIILPDKVYYDLDGYYGGGKFNIDAQFAMNDVEDVDFTLCKLDGTEENWVAQSATAPENPKDMEQWIDTSAVPHTLKQYSAVTGKWSDIATTYVKIQTLFIGSDFSRYDGVTIEGIPENGPSNLNGSAVILAVGPSYIVIAGELNACTQLSGVECQLKVTRSMPEMDFVIEAGNRLWGCRYSAGINEIYASKLGDFKNWNCFMGLSTDSYAASCGTDGPFTGVVSYNGQPMFFKENYVHKVYGDYPANFQIQTATIPGVQFGSSKSLAVVNGVLYYKGINGIYAYDGSFPVMVSQALGCTRYGEAVAGSLDAKYYISMKNMDTEGYHLMVYDTVYGMWHREDDLKVDDFVVYGTMSQLLAACRDQEKIITMKELSDNEYGREGPIKWMVETGEMGVSSPDMKYISRLTIRMAMDEGSEVAFYAKYDHSDSWEHLGVVKSTSMRSFSLPIRPKRCDFMKLRIEGEGLTRIYSITKTIERGSELS